MIQVVKHFTNEEPKNVFNDLPKAIEVEVVEEFFETVGQIEASIPHSAPTVRSWK